jgi:hypothetical protein
MAKGKPRGRTGRPGTGLRPGEKASKYQRITARLPPETFEHLRAGSRALGAPIWRVIAAAAASYVGAGEPLTDTQREIARLALKEPPGK